MHVPGTGAPRRGRAGWALWRGRDRRHSPGHDAPDTWPHRFPFLPSRRFTGAGPGTEPGHVPGPGSRDTGGRPAARRGDRGAVPIRQAPRPVCRGADLHPDRRQPQAVRGIGGLEWGAWKGCVAAQSAVLETVSNAEGACVLGALPSSSLASDETALDPMDARCPSCLLQLLRAAARSGFLGWGARAAGAVQNAQAAHLRLRRRRRQARGVGWRGARMVCLHSPPGPPPPGPTPAPPSPLARSAQRRYKQLYAVGDQYSHPGKTWKKRAPVRLLYTNGNHYDLLVAR